MVSVHIKNQAVLLLQKPLSSCFTPVLVLKKLEGCPISSKTSFLPHVSSHRIYPPQIPMLSLSLSVSLTPSLSLFPLPLELSRTRHFTYPLVENVQLSLVLQTENKGSVVTGGELNVCLDGMVVDLGSLPNGSTAADSESHLYHTHTHMQQQINRDTHDEPHTYCVF